MRVMSLENLREICRKLNESDRKIFFSVSHGKSEGKFEIDKEVKECIAWLNLEKESKKEELGLANMC